MPVDDLSSASDAPSWSRSAVITKTRWPRRTAVTAARCSVWRAGSWATPSGPKSWCKSLPAAVEPAREVRPRPRFAACVLAGPRPQPVGRRAAVGHVSAPPRGTRRVAYGGSGYGHRARGLGSHGRGAWRTAVQALPKESATPSISRTSGGHTYREVAGDAERAGGNGEESHSLRSARMRETLVDASYAGWGRIVMTHDDLQELLARTRSMAVDAGRTRRRRSSPPSRVPPLPRRGGRSARDRRAARPFGRRRPRRCVEPHRRRVARHPRRRFGSRCAIPAGVIPAKAMHGRCSGCGVCRSRRGDRGARSERAAPLVPRRRTSSRPLSSSIDLASAANAAMTEPGARVARLRGEQGQSVVAVVRPNGQGYLLGDALPALDHRVYTSCGARRKPGRSRRWGRSPVRASTPSPPIRRCMS